jgi:hypothetical protein
MLPIDKVIPVAFINCFEQASADLWQDPDADVLIFEINNPVSFVRLNIG